ncbi:MAG: glycine-rich domain-containing protein [Anaerolineales bacterium]
MPSFGSINLRTDLLEGDYSAATFNTALTDPTIAAQFTELVNSCVSAETLANSTVALPVILGSANARTIAANGPAFLRACANSGYATHQLVTTLNGANLFALVLADTTGHRFSHWRNISANYQRLKTYVNATGSRLRRQTFTTSGTWTLPATLRAMSIFAVGGGGGSENYSEGGGGGGEIVCANVVELPNTNQMVTIGAGGTGGQNTGSPGGNTSVGTLINAIGGNGTTSSIGGAGGGTTTNGGYKSFTDWEDPLNAVFQCVSASQKGGDGGNYGSGIGKAGGDGLPGTGGRPGFTVPWTAAQPGRRFGGGGGGYGDGPYGVSADANSGAGAGGRYANGGSGIVVIYWLE